MESLEKLKKSERLKVVRKLRSKGMKVENIAKALDVSERTIYNDLSDLREESRKFAVNAEHWQELGSGLTRYEDLFEMSLSEFEDCGAASDRHKFLKLAISCHEKKMDLFMNSGVIPKAAVQHHHTEVPLEQMSATELKNRRVAILREIIVQLPEEERKKITHNQELQKVLEVK